MKTSIALLALTALLLPAAAASAQTPAANQTTNVYDPPAPYPDWKKVSPGVFQDSTGKIHHMVPAMAASGHEIRSSASGTTMSGGPGVDQGTKKADTVPILAVGAVAPDFMAKDIAGKEVRLSDYKGKVVVLDFWATWCGPCKASLPHTQEVAKYCKDQGVVVLANCTGDTRAYFEAFVKANREQYADILFASDPNEKGSATFADRASHKLYGCSGIPTQFVIGRDGKVAAVLVGYNPNGDHKLEGALVKLGIKIPSAPEPATAKPALSKQAVSHRHFLIQSA